ncbi:MAG: O-antigen ligase family protein [Nitrospiraceae bacterium]|nr:O-antigen ligase family protein [Nitrospiraceae bacterium]
MVIKKENLGKYIWAAGAGLLCYSAVKIIANESFFWAAVPALPLLAYLAIKRPFVFPFGAYVFLIPFDAILSITGHETGTTLTKILGILTMLGLLLKGSFEKRFVRADKTVICWTFLSLLAISSVLWALDPEQVMIKIPTILGLLAFYLVVSFYGTTEKEWSALKTAALLGGFFAALLSIYDYYSGNFFGMDTQRATLMFGTRETNPNNLGFCMLIPSAICMEILSSGKKFNWEKPVYILMLAVLLFCVIVTGSRETLLAIGIIFAVFVLSSKRKLTLGLVLITVSVPLAFLMLQFLTERWQNAFSTGGAGRFNIWRVGIKAFGSFWTTGAGLENFPIAYTRFVDYAPGFSGFFRASHNIYLGLAVELGLAGIVLLFWGFKRHYALIRSNRDPGGKDKIMLTAVFWGMLAQSFFGDFFWDKPIWLLWMMVIIYHNVQKSPVNGKRVFRQ